MRQNLHMQEDPFKKKEKWIKGICIRPVTMRNYFTWLDAKPALTVRLSTLPVQIAILPYLSAIFMLEANSVIAKQPLGLLRRISVALCLSLGISPDYCEKAIRFHVAANDITNLTGISVLVPEKVQEKVLCGSNRRFQTTREAIAAEGEDAPRCKILETDEEVRLQDGKNGTINRFIGEFITVEYTAFPKEPTATFRPMEFTRIREAIAELNGVEIPDEAENTDLVEARAKKAEVRGIALDVSMESMLDAVAMLSGIQTKDLADWTILEFEQRKKTIDRVLRFMICGIGESSGSQWKNGNPYPSWCFDRSEGMFGGFTPIGQVLGKLGHSEAWLDQQIENQQKQKKG